MSTTNAKHLGNDLELVSGAQKGDEEAFAALYERHAPIAWRMGLAITGRPESAATTTAESFARTFAAVRAGRDVAGPAFRSQLLTIVRNTAVDARRHRTGTADGFAYAGPDAAAIATAFAPLPERWRSTLWLHEVEGMQLNRVAPVVGLTPAATVSLAERARNGLVEQYLAANLAGSANRTCTRAVARMGSYVAGTLAPPDAEKLERHLRLCPDCADRHDHLADVGRHLRLLILPLPDTVTEDARAAWTAAVVAASARTGTGLSSATEKVLAGVSAVAAAVGVFGATMLNAGNGSDDRRAAAAAAPAAESTDTTEPVEHPSADVAADIPPIELPNPDNTGTNRIGTISRTSGSTSGPSADPAPRPAPEEVGVIGAGDPGGEVTPARDLEPTAPRVDAPDTAVPDPDSGDDDPAPAAKVATEVGDVPVAVEVGEDPGITVGPVTLGSEPAVEGDDPIVSLDGPLAPLAPVVDPVVEPVDEAVSELTDGLGL